MGVGDEFDLQSQNDLWHNNLAKEVENEGSLCCPLNIFQVQCCLELTL